MTSTIAISGHLWRLPAPPLKIGLRSSTTGPTIVLVNETILDGNGGDIWSAFNTIIFKNFYKFLDSDVAGPFYMFNETSLEEEALKKDGRCIAEDAYSWGFSSLLLLTFCSYTISFALALILLQTDVYWNSRSDRNHQSHSIYTDVLYLAEELKNTFGQNVEDHMQSSKAFDTRIGDWKQGLRLNISELPPSRWQEQRMPHATERAKREAKISFELRDMSPHDRERYSAVSVTMYDRLMAGWRAKSNFEATSRSDVGNTTSEELAPSLAGAPISTECPVVEDSVHRDAAIELQNWAPQTRLPGLG